MSDLDAVARSMIFLSRPPPQRRGRHDPRRTRSVIVGRIHHQPRRRMALVDGEHTTVLEDLHRARAATHFHPLADMREWHAVLPPFEGNQAVDPDHAHTDIVKRFRQDLGQRCQLRAFRRPALRHRQARCRANQLVRPSCQLRVRPLL